MSEVLFLDSHLYPSGFRHAHGEEALRFRATGFGTSEASWQGYVSSWTWRLIGPVLWRAAAASQSRSPLQLMQV